MECKKCGITIDETQARKVAHWAFCPQCFQALLEESEKVPAERAVEVESVAKPAESQQQRCLVCEQPLAAGEGQAILGLQFCQQCHEALVKLPDLPSRSRVVAEMPKEEEAVPQVEVDLRSTVPCHACRRQIPLLGSKEFDGERYCPDCYSSLPEVLADKPEPAPEVLKRAAARQEEGRGARPCAVCQRAVAAVNLKEIEGFEICRACLSTEPETALEIAHARHRMAMEEMKKGLDVNFAEDRETP